MDAYHQARKNGKIAYFNYRTLVVKEPPLRTGTGEEGPASPGEPRTPTTSTPPTPQGTDRQTQGYTSSAWPRLDGGNNDRWQFVASSNGEGAKAPKPRTSSTGV